MITVRRAASRHYDRRARREVWLTFAPDDATGFGILERFNESLLPPGAATPRHPKHDAEIVTYVWEGALAHEDSVGYSGIIQAGEFHRLTSGGGLRHSQSNASRTDWVRVFQVWLRPVQSDLEADRAQKRFSAAQRRNGLCVVASPDQRSGSLKLNQDAVILSALLDAGQHVVHELAGQRSAWLHLLVGCITVDDTVLSAGDSAGIADERVVSFTAQKYSEILLLDLPPPSRSLETP